MRGERSYLVRGCNGLSKDWIDLGIAGLRAEKSSNAISSGVIDQGGRDCSSVEPRKLGDAIILKCNENNSDGSGLLSEIDLFGVAAASTVD